MNDTTHDYTVHFVGFKQHPLEHVGMKKNSSLEFDATLEDEAGQRNHFIPPPQKFAWNTGNHHTCGVSPFHWELKSLSNEKNTWLVRLYRGLCYPVI